MKNTHDLSKMTEEQIIRLGMSLAGKKGGASGKGKSTPAKRQAGRLNIAKAREVKAKNLYREISPELEALPE